MDREFQLVPGTQIVLDGLPVYTESNEFLGETGKAEMGARVVSLEEALRLATRFNRRYLAAKEDLYLQALSLSLDRYQWSAGLGLDLPLDRKRERNNFRAVIIAHDRSRRQAEQFVDQIKLEIQDGWRNLDQRKREFEISEIRVQLSQSRREEELLKRELGLGLALDLVDAQNDLISHTVARLAFWRDMGVLFIKENGQWEEGDFELVN